MVKKINVISIMLSILILLFAAYSVLFFINSYNAKIAMAQGYFLNKYHPKNPASINHLRRSLAIDPYDFNSRWLLAQIYNIQDNPAEASVILNELLGDIEHIDIRMELYKSYQKMDDFDKQLDQLLEIYFRYNFYGEDYVSFIPRINNHIEFKLLRFIAVDNFEEIESFLSKIFSYRYNKLPYEHFRGISYVFENDCEKAVEYFAKYYSLYINKQLLGIYAHCLEKQGHKQSAENLLNIEKEKWEKNPISFHLIEYYEKNKN